MAGVSTIHTVRRIPRVLSAVQRMITAATACAHPPKKARRMLNGYQRLGISGPATRHISLATQAAASTLMYFLRATDSGSVPTKSVYWVSTTLSVAAYDGKTAVVGPLTDLTILATNSVPSANKSLLYSVDFSQQPAGVAVLPSWLNFSRASTATVQTGLATVLTGLSNDQPRLGDDGLGHRGLVLEEPRTNCQGKSSPRTWAAISVTITPISGPSGANSAAACADSNNTVQGWASDGSSGLITAQATVYIGSAWMIDLSDGVGGQGSYNPNVVPSSVVNRPLTAWTRVAGNPMVVSSNTGTSSLIPTTNNQPSSRPLTGTMGYDLLQIEDGNFPTEAIITTGAPVKREGERLWLSDASMAVQNGRVSIEIACYPKGVYTAYKNSQIVFFMDGNNHAKISQGKVYVIVGGVLLPSTSTYTFAPNDFVEIWLQAGNGVPQCSMRINGGTVIRHVFPDTSQVALPSTGTMDLLCAGAGGNQFISRVKTISIYAAGAKPAWW